MLRSSPVASGSQDGRAPWIRTGYVEAVAVRRDRWRQGLGAAVMREVEELGPVLDHDLLALSSSVAGMPL